MKKIIFPIVVLTLLPALALAEKRFAERGEGVRLNQRFAVLPNGTVYADEKGEVLDKEKYFTPNEIEENQRAFVFYLDRKRYWHSGVPPRGTFLERHKATMEAKKSHERLQSLLGNENWFQFEADEGPPDQGG